MRCVFVVLICLHFSSMVSSNVNYCGAKMCGNSDMHTFCQYTDKPGIQCIGFVPAPLTNQEKKNIVSRINQRRKDAAMGMLANLPTAADMTAMRWVDELAREAQLWANQCAAPEFPGLHDLCRDLYTIPVGQTVASVVGEAPGLRVETLVDLWYMQGKHYKGSVKSYIPPSYNQSYYGDFAQMLWSPTFMVGCARTKFMSVFKGRGHSVTRLVCNMAPRGPRAAHPLWTEGPPASRCPPRTTPSDSALCIPNVTQAFNEKKNRTSLQHAVLLSTLAEIEKNSSLDYIGRLDEIYLTKLAAVTMEQSNKASQAKRLKTLEAITSKLGVKLSDHNNVIMKRIAYERRKIRRYLGKPKRKLRLIGRPKPYYLYELTPEEDKKITKNTDYSKTTVTINNINEKCQTVAYDEKTDVSPIDTKTITSKITNNTNADINVDVKDLEKDSTTLSNEIPYEEDEQISDEVIQDYLSNPETAREIQDTLLRSEQWHALEKMSLANFSDNSSVSSTSSDPVTLTRTKVRRELRTTHEVSGTSEDFEEFKRSLKKAIKPPKLLEDPAKNTIVKGTMVDSLIRSIPSLRTFISSASRLRATCTNASLFSIVFLSFYTFA